MKFILTFGLCISFLVSSGQHLIDIRPEKFKNNQPPQEILKEGRKILKETMKAHGWDTVDENSNIIITYRDIWSHRGQKLNPWPKDYNSLTQTFKIGTFNTSRIVVNGGQKDGYVYGIRNGETYEGNSIKDTLKKPNPYMKFFLPTYEYFYKMPFMTKYTPITYYLGEENTNGVTYQKVFGSWSMGPDKNYDQYIFWINKKTKLLEFVSYTIRELGDQNIGGMFFTDFRSFDKLLIPATQKVVKKPGDTDDLHTLKLISLELEH